MLLLRNRHLFLADLVLLPSAAVLAFALRLDAQGLARYTAEMLLFLALAVPVQLLVAHWLGIYARLWRYASLDELVVIALSTGISCVLVGALLFGAALPLAGMEAFPRSVPLIDGLLALLVMGAPRFGYRLAWRSHARAEGKNGLHAARRVVVVGAGDAGAMIAKEMLVNPRVGLVPVAFVDDDEHKHGARVHGVPVLGGRERIPEIVRARRAQEVIIAMPTAPGALIREVRALAEAAGVPARTVPGMYDILSGRLSVNQIRRVEIEDLLRREPVQTDTTAIRGMLHGAWVMVTGAGGSIGSELCRQIAACEPAVLILVGHGENSIYAISNELRRRWPGLAVRQVVADVRDEDRLRRVFEEYAPQVIFHAAAHKHVPLMEANVAEAVSNNVQGTANLLRLAEAHDVERFVLISSDKAVNPTSIMGTTKRVAELLVQKAAKRSGRPYVAVRFGNVLGSRGSVVPLFQEQIARGGPVTVTHPDMRRYFMTIPEAVQLVLQAAALGQGGEVFLLDMGEPVRIVDLARDLIELSGLEMGHDVEIQFTGMRPGEKLFEELMVSGEEYGPTRHQKVYVSRNGKHASPCPVPLEQSVAELVDLARRGDEGCLRAKLHQIVPEYSGNGNGHGPR